MSLALLQEATVNYGAFAAIGAGLAAIGGGIGIAGAQGGLSGSSVCCVRISGWSPT